MTDKFITSRDNSAFKSLRLLAKDTREQQRRQRTLLEGVHLVADYRARVGAPELLVVSESGEGHAEVQALLAAHGDVETLRLRDALFGEISSVATPVGVLAVIAVPPAASGALGGSAVLLEGIQDAGNVGTILRTAAAAGIIDIVLGPGCAGAWTPRVLRAAMGAHFSLALRETADLVATARGFAGLSVATLVRGGTPLYELDLAGPVAWIFGNEGAGVSAALAAAAKARATIPMHAASESLNVAGAAAVCLFEAVRQRKTA